MGDFPVYLFTDPADSLIPSSKTPGVAILICTWLIISHINPDLVSSGHPSVRRQLLEDGQSSVELIQPRLIRLDPIHIGNLFGADRLTEALQGVES